ncbi:MAG TPA: YdeI/OmpD-associated family protein [Spirochaetia bacterium]|nr:YdeI/OmpD-associated family protein [Spirochaetia bacterium]
MPDRAELKIVRFKDQESWDSWLEKHHAVSPGVWLQIAKKAADAPSVSYAEAVEAALCFGWIDGQKKPFDEAWWLQRFTPRRPTSIWARANREKAEELIRDGRMKLAGLKAVETARQSGRWDRAYDSARTAGVPADLQKAFARNARAKAFFATLDSANRYAVLWRVQTAIKPETRARRIEKLIGMLERNEKLHP